MAIANECDHLTFYSSDQSDDIIKHLKKDYPTLPFDSFDDFIEAFNQNYIKKFPKIRADQISYIFYTEEGELKSSFHADQMIVPASVGKVPIVVAAFDVLAKNNPAYEFLTVLQYNSQSKFVHLVGGADPAFSREDLKLMARKLANELKMKKTTSIKGIIYDDTIVPKLDYLSGKYFKGQHLNTAVSALSLDHPDYAGRGFDVSDGKIINIKALSNPSQYASELLRSYLKSYQIQVGDLIKKNDGDFDIQNDFFEIQIEHRSSLNKAFESILKYSSNSGAELLGMIVAKELVKENEKWNEPKTHKESVEIVKNYLENKYDLCHTLDIKNFSGLNPENYLSPFDLALFLMELFKQETQEIRPAQFLAMSGEQGTLKSMFKRFSIRDSSRTDDHFYSRKVQGKTGYISGAVNIGAKVSMIDNQDYYLVLSLNDSLILKRQWEVGTAATTPQSREANDNMFFSFRNNFFRLLIDPESFEFEQR